MLEEKKSLAQLSVYGPKIEKKNTPIKLRNDFPNKVLLFSHLLSANCNPRT